MHSYRLWLLLPAAALLAGCTPGASEPAGDCGDPKRAHKVYHGTLEPTQVPLTSSQILAIGFLQRCTGTLIAPTWVLTARHCEIRPFEQFCMGPDPTAPDLCVPLAWVVDHPTLDVTLLELAEEATVVLPEVEPLAIMTHSLSRQWLGRMAEAAGYGQTETGTLGTRYFTAEPVAEVDSTYVTIDGQNRRGVCFGDSGGPVMVLADDGSVRVAGALSYGDESCMGRDSFTRTDAIRGWIEGYTGPIKAEPSPCL